MRDHVPQAELFTLNDYRLRHAQYRTDPDLQAAHAAHPFLMTWDDHEFKDNYADLDLDPNEPLETVAARRAAAYLAYWEHAPLPVRASRRQGHAAVPAVAVGRPRHVPRARHAPVPLGPARAQCAPAQRDPVSRYCPGVLDSTRGILGTAQRDWLFGASPRRPRHGT